MAHHGTCRMLAPTHLSSDEAHTWHCVLALLRSHGLELLVSVDDGQHVHVLTLVLVDTLDLCMRVHSTRSDKFSKEKAQWTGVVPTGRSVNECSLSSRQSTLTDPTLKNVLFRHPTCKRHLRTYANLKQLVNINYVMEHS